MYSSEQIPNINGCLCGRVFKFSKSIGCNILSYPLPLGSFSPSWRTYIQHEGLNGEAYPACTICFKHAVHVHNHKKSFLGSISPLASFFTLITPLPVVQSIIDTIIFLSACQSLQLLLVLPTTFDD